MPDSYLPRFLDTMQTKKIYFPTSFRILFILIALNITWQENAKADFDFYVLSLSWSPSYCEAQRQQANDDNNSRQCKPKPSRPFSFVVHGLWPQLIKGWPSYCTTQYGTFVPNNIINSMLDIMPSKGLIIHQWKKHGTCSGLSIKKYFDLTRIAYQKINIPLHLQSIAEHRLVSPQAIEKAFLDVNPDLSAKGIAITCDKKRLREARICMTKKLNFTACKQVDRKSCQKNRVIMPPTR